jgi:hypothetical protein
LPEEAVEEAYLSLEILQEELGLFYLYWKVGNFLPDYLVLEL